MRHILKFSEVKEKIESKRFHLQTTETEYKNTNSHLSVKCFRCDSICLVILRNFMRAELGCKFCAMKLRHEIARNKVSPESKHLRQVRRHMIQRCYDKTNKQYKDYGLRGIRVCKSWYRSREKFYLWAIKSGYKPGLMIDRINNDESYKPSNCRWATSKEQNNNRRNNLIVIFKGKAQTLGQWATELGIPHETLRERYHKKWSPEKILGGNRV